jgi:hypothetical protein
MEDDLTFDEFAVWLRGYRKIPIRKAITPETQFERDLGITGDDGVELLEAAAQRFMVKFESEETGPRESFNLQANEYLFNAEGWGPSPGELSSLISRQSVVRKFTVGELYEAVARTKSRGTDSRQQ